MLPYGHPFDIEKHTEFQAFDNVFDFSISVMESDSKLRWCLPSEGFVKYFNFQIGGKYHGSD